jgi:hypothetical protein
MNTAIPFRLFLLPLVAILGLGLTGCNKNPSAHGDADASLAYWNRLNEDRPDYADVAAAFAGWEFAPGSERGQLMRMDGFLALQILDLTERNQKLGQLPMRNIDPALLDYTAQLASANATRIRVMEQARALLRQIQQLTSPGQLGLDFLGSYFRHANDKEPLLAMLGDQLREKTKTVGDIIPQVMDLESKLLSLQPLNSNLAAVEVSIRATLHQNHDRDFKPSSSFDKKSPKPTDLNRVFTNRRVILDLLGQQFGDWTFENLEEFRAVKIERRIQIGNRAELYLTCDVIGARAGPRSIAFVMIYELRGDTWVLLGLAPKPTSSK